jgi:hypothetical protein
MATVKKLTVNVAEDKGGLTSCQGITLAFLPHQLPVYYDFQLVAENSMSQCPGNFAKFAATKI